MKRSHITSATSKDVLVRFRKCDLLSGVSDQQFDDVLSRVRILSLAEGEVLFLRHQVADEVFWIESGQMKLSVSSQSGSEKVIEIESSGATFAEAVLFDGRPRFPVQATAVKSSQIWCIDAKHYESLLRNCPDVCFSVMGKLSRRLHGLISEIDRLALHNATYRVVAYLLDHIPCEDQDGASQVQLDVPKHVIASRLSITPETLSRTFSKLCRSGVINLTDSKIIIDDIDSLRQFVHWDQAAEEG